MIKKLKSEITTSIKNRKINVFFLFLVFAFVILIVTKLSKDYTNTVAFNIEKINIPQKNLILNHSQKLNITLKTHGFKWLQYYITPPKIIIDFQKDVYKKESDFVWSKSVAYLNNTQFDKQVELLNISPDTLLFKYAVNLVKKVPVKSNISIHFSPGYNTSKNMVLTPDSITVVGPDVLVSKINFIETKDITINDVKSNLTEKIPLNLPRNNQEISYSSREILAKTTVEKFTEGTLSVPILIINTPKDKELKYFPKMVTVSYYVSLSNYNNVTKQDFKVICDYNKISDNQTFLIPEFETITEQVKSAKINQQRIEFIVN